VSLPVFALAVVSIVILFAMIAAAAYFLFNRLLVLLTIGPFHTLASPPGILGLPSIATTILALVDGVLSVLVHNNFGLSMALSSALSTGLVLLGGLGIQPLLGAAFETALHLPFQVTALISAGMSALTYWLSTNPVGISPTAAGWITGVIAALSALGFGTTVASVAKAAGLKTSAL
jgi:hypothetical protein